LKDEGYKLEIIFGANMLKELFEIIEDRKINPTPGSYTARLLAEGEDRILQKVGEEAIEVILAAKGQGNQRLVEEISDLFYHTLVLLSSKGMTLQDVEAELRRRHLS
jgi:phosphoribosyl-ATP pyrophosphohydrolase